jgi:hypothetical protein
LRPEALPAHDLCTSTSATSQAGNCYRCGGSSAAHGCARCSSRPMIRQNHPGKRCKKALRWRPRRHGRVTNSLGMLGGEQTNSTKPFRIALCARGCPGSSPLAFAHSEQEVGPECEDSVPKQNPLGVGGEHMGFCDKCREHGLAKSAVRGKAVQHSASDAAANLRAATPDSSRADGKRSAPSGQRGYPLTLCATFGHMKHVRFMIDPARCTTTEFAS